MSGAFDVDRVISDAAPSEADVAAQAELDKVFGALNLVESEDEAQQRVRAIKLLNGIVIEWAKEVSLSLGLSEAAAAECRPRLFSFGSYRLGVHTPGADIDMLVVGPRHLTREHAFDSLYKKLKLHQDVSELTAVPDAHVPIMKFMLAGVDFDLLYAALLVDALPENLAVTELEILRGLDMKTVRSLNGARVAEEMLRAVPNRDTFRRALRLIKYWAKQRGIYGNAYGYPGGVAWALMVARACRFFPKANPAQLVRRLFFLYTHWKWPQPVCVKVSEKHPDIGLDDEVFDSESYMGQRALMPVLTPAYPCMNSTYNVNTSSLRHLTLEWKRAHEVLNSVKVPNGDTWRQLLRPASFFADHTHFLELSTWFAPEEGETLDEEDGLAIWGGYAEARIRTLVANVHSCPEVYAHVLPMKFKLLASDCVSVKETLQARESGNTLKPETKCIAFYVAIVPVDDMCAGIDLRSHVNSFISMLGSFNRFVPGMDAALTHVTRRELPNAVFPDGRNPFRAEKRPMPETHEAPDAKKPKTTTD